MPPQRKAGKRGASSQKTKGTLKSEQPTATAEHGTGGPGSPMAETHVGNPPEGDTKPGLQVIVLVRIYPPFLCVPIGTVLLFCYLLLAFLHPCLLAL